jgi:hypothetical protein
MSIKKHISTKLKWLSYNSSTPVTMDQISDDHLHNIVHHLHQLSEYYNKDSAQRIILYAMNRGVDIQSAMSEQKPFINSQGQTVVWDYSKKMEGYPV